jgi:tRNA-dihydrouridine synthase C
MDGLADAVLRDVLTRCGQYDFCVTEFVRITDSLLPSRMFKKSGPELDHGCKTFAGTPVRVQLLGSDPERLAQNAARLASLNPAGIDLNFGCPAPTVNRHRGGAALLEEPELLHRIASAVRQSVPAHISFTAKMRLGLKDTALTLDCARALAEGGIDELTVHARTKLEMYNPPAHWHWIGRIADVLTIPVIANGEIWTMNDYQQCLAESGVPDVMLGRGAVCDPFLSNRLRGLPVGGWDDLKPLIGHFWSRVIQTVVPKHAPGRLKNWLNYLQRTFPEAQELRHVIRPLTTIEAVSHCLTLNGIDSLHG